MVKKSLHKKSWMSEAVKIHVEPPHIPLIKINIDTKSEKYYVATKLRRNPMPKASDMHEFKFFLFENGYTEEFLLFQHKYQMTLKASGSISAGTNIQYLRTLILGEDLRKSKNICGNIGNSTTTHLKQIILGLGKYFVPINVMLN